MKFKMLVLSGQNQIAEFEGTIDVGNDSITVQELEDILELETKLERYFGLRFHISNSDQE